MPISTDIKGSKIARRLLCALNSWVTFAVVMTIISIFPALRFVELSRLSYRLRDEGNTTADWVQAEALAWWFGAMISILTAMFLWGMDRAQNRRRSTFASMATACDCDTDDQDPDNHEKGCQNREFLCLKAYETINRMRYLRDRHPNRASKISR